MITTNIIAVTIHYVTANCPHIVSLYRGIHHTFSLANVTAHIRDLFRCHYQQKTATGMAKLCEKSITHIMYNAISILAIHYCSQIVGNTRTNREIFHLTKFGWHRLTELSSVSMLRPDGLYPRKSKLLCRNEHLLGFDFYLSCRMSSR